jgi:hypothetical protein
MFETVPSKFIRCDTLYADIWWTWFKLRLTDSIAHINVEQPWASRLVAGVAGSNPAEGMDVCLLCVYVVLSCCVGIGLCDGLVTRPEESYRICQLYVIKNLSSEEKS